MTDEYFQNKDEKDLKDSELNENESENSLDIQENDNEEFFSANPMNVDMTYKASKDDNILNNNKEQKEMIGDNEDEYIALIEGLENELLIEQYITNSLKKDPNFNEEINKLKTELNNKNSKLEQLKLINKKQENTLTEFKSKLKKEINKKGMNNKVIINNEVSKNEAINNAIKLKDSALINVLNKMNSLKKENEELKKKIYQNESNFNCSHNNNSIYEDSSQKNLEKIKFLQNEIKILNKQLIEHNKCIEDQNTVNKEYNNLKNELKLLKINNQDIKNKIKEFEKKILNIEINDINNNSIMNSNFNNLTMKKNNNIHLNFTNKRQSSVKSNTFSRTIMKSQKQNLLPIISIQPLVPNTYNYLYNQNNNNKSILSDDFLKKIKKYFNNENEYFNLINKISMIENMGNNENISFRELKKYNTQFVGLDKKPLLNIEIKGKDNNIRMMNYKLNTLKEENKLQNKKIEELQKNLENIKNLGKEKENEISMLLSKINSMKNELKSK